MTPSPTASRCPPAGPNPAHRAARAPARSLAPAIPAASPRCPGSPSSCACPPPADRGPGQPRRPGTPAPLALAPDAPTADIRIGYARCSTLTQELQSQLDALAKHGTPREKVFSEKVSTRVRVHPQFEAPLALARCPGCTTPADRAASYSRSSRRWRTPSGRTSAS
ncbi:recombinase family protein [Streptomyces sp. 840.1]|uniref:recombinase family protein n=1 Tax=Streptomyces sp. 840.1 TaxID=2485152 RepID=UPI0021A8E36A|nr:recombinase family protein [Streptomyces sp. 840.1]